MNKEKLERLKSVHRINKAISKVAPHDFLLEMAQGGIFLSPQERCDPEMLKSFFSIRDDLRKRRAELRDRIIDEHPEWYNKAPKTEEIVVFLDTPEKVDPFPSA